MPATRTRLSPTERREHLLEVAETLFETEGFDEVSMSDIARAAGVSHGLVYHYFPSKRAIRRARIEREAALVEAALAPDPSLPPHLRSWAAMERLVAHAERHPKDFVDVLRADEASDPDIAQILRRIRDGSIDAIVDQIGCRPLPMLLLSLQGWMGSVERTLVQWLENPTVDRDALVRWLVLSLRSALDDALTMEPQPLSPILHEMIFGSGVPDYS